MKWELLEGVPKDGSTFLAWQDGEIYHARYDRGDPRRLCFRVHSLFEPETHRIIDAEMDGRPVKARVLTEKGPEEFRHDWCFWTRGFEFSPTHWSQLPAGPETELVR